MRKCEGHDESVNSVAFSPYGEYLTTGKNDLEN